MMELRIDDGCNDRSGDELDDSNDGLDTGAEEDSDDDGLLLGDDDGLLLGGY